MPEPGTGPGATVVVCVHQGERVLPATLRALAAQDAGTSMRVVVACNGCTDTSAGVARAHAPAFARRGHELLVLALPGASRPAALNAAEPHAEGARVYLDQDAVLAPGGLRALLGALDGSCHFATLRLALAEPVPWLVRGYHRAWSRLPYVRASPVTAGLYAVSASGRARWGAVPDLHSDDKFARLHFAPHERRLVPSHTYTVRPHAGLRALARARGRYGRGNRELARRFPDLARHDGRRHAGLARLLVSPAGWKDLGVLLAVRGASAVLGTLDALPGGARAQGRAP